MKNIRLYSIVLIMTGIGAIVAPPVSAGEERAISLEYPADKISSIAIEIFAGTLHVVQRDVDKITVDGTLQVRGSEKRSLKRLNALSFEVTQEREFKLVLPPNPGWYLADLVITVPADADLDVKLRYGFLHADLAQPEETRVRTRVQMTAGEMTVSLPESASAGLTAATTMGDVRLLGFSEWTSQPSRLRLVGAKYEGIIGDPLRVTDQLVDLKLMAGEIKVLPQDASSIGGLSRAGSIDQIGSRGD